MSSIFRIFRARRVPATVDQLRSNPPRMLVSTLGASTLPSLACTRKYALSRLGILLITYLGR